MSNYSEAFYAGIYDGVAQSETQEKVASVFFEGLRDGVAEATRAPIMDKIASLVEEDAVEEQEQELSLSDVVRQRITGDA